MTVLELEEATVRGTNDAADGDDLATIAARREQRYRQREARHRANRWLDPRLADLYLDRTQLNATQAAAELGITVQRVYYLRMEVRERRPTKAEVDADITVRRVHRLRGPHPALFLDPDGVAGQHFGKADYTVERGRLLEWAVQSGRKRWVSKLGILVPSKPRVGRPRRLRVIQERAARRARRGKSS